MRLQSLTLLAIVSVVASGCAITTGPVNDGFELSNESLDNGKFFGEDLLTLEVDAADIKKHIPSTGDQ